MKSLCFFQCQEDYNGNMYLPYSSGILWTYLTQFNTIKENYSLIDLFFEKIDPAEYIEKLKNNPPDFALFSNYGWNTTYHLAVAELIKKTWPDCKIIIGGPNSQQEQEYLLEHYYVDISVWGEGEQTLLELLLEFLKPNAVFEQIPGISYIKNNQYIKTSTRERNKKPDNIPSPYLSGIFDDFFAKYNYNFMPIWETNRGCPYHCTFCDLGTDYYNKLHIFATERLTAEINWFVDKKIEYVEIADANFGILERDLNLVKYIKKIHDETGYPKKINATWAKNSPDRVFEMSVILDRMNRGGVTLALQSSNPIALGNIKRFNIVNDRLENITKKYIQYNIQTYHDFIIGLPGETLESWKQGILQVVDVNPEGWIFGHPLEAYKNTEFQDQSYIDKNKIKFVTTPQVSFFAKRKKNLPVEKGNYVVEHYSMSFDDYIEKFLFKWFIISVHSLGWTKTIAQNISKKTDTLASTFYLKLYNWMRLNPCVLQQEYRKTRQCLENTLNNGLFWGRQIFGTDDIYWEYESASCITFENKRTQFFADLKQFLNNQYSGVDAEYDLIRNDLELICYNRTYPYHYENITVYGENFNNFQEFCTNIYWYRRRQQGWKTKINE